MALAGVIPETSFARFRVSVATFSACPAPPAAAIPYPWSKLEVAVSRDPDPDIYGRPASCHDAPYRAKRGVVDEESSGRA